VYFSNRSAAAANLGRFEEALQDAKAVLRLKPGWVKGHARAAAAYMGLQLYSEAKEVCGQCGCARGSGCLNVGHV
jgi:stress-induced-phosphoprotein 1